MSNVEAVRTYISTYSGLTEGAPVWVNHLGGDPDQYAIIPLAGAKIVEHYLDGSTLREFPFALQSTESTADDLERLENAGFYEAYADWLEAQTAAGILPTLGEGQTAESIEAVSGGYLYEQGQSDTGIYQIICKLTYSQRP